MVSKTPELDIYGLTDEGLVREHNEDYISWSSESGLVILADGMGGHNAGEVASELAVTSIREALNEVLSPEIKDSCGMDFKEVVHEAVVYANDEINQHAKEHPECSGMGTTIVMTLFHNDSVILASVGDSRIYRFRKGELKQVTIDHSLVQEMVDNGYMSEEEALNSNNRNLITRALGIAEDVKVDVTEHETEKNDIYLLCSDGLSDMIDDELIFSTLVKSRQDLKRAGEDLVKLAKEHGGHDNVSVILV
ncbi:MAG: Stp1/IreP family PP2C-type Ser/Thr phosphatase, partial [Gammaproteobacteria bacterium]|nr:Stp1/IreP family PP2C-type Ser/Thr phosphatase [Gammaproteobacteria bacterium]